MSLFLYMKFEISIREIEDAATYCKVLGGGIYYYYYFFMEASCDPALRCDAFFVNLNFHCIEHFIYTIVSFVLVCLYLSLHILLFLNAYPPLPFFCVCLTLLVFPPCPKVVVMPLTFYRRDFFFFFLLFTSFFRVWCFYSNINPSISSSRSS